MLKMPERQERLPAAFGRLAGLDGCHPIGRGCSYQLMDKQAPTAMCDSVTGTMCHPVIFKAPKPMNGKADHRGMHVTRFMAADSSPQAMLHSTVQLSVG